MLHPNGVVGLDHIVVTTPDLERTANAFATAGCAERRRRSAGSGRAALVQIFYRSGRVIIELVGPETTTSDGPAAFFGLACTVSDLVATVTYLGDAIGPARPAVQRGRHIATLRHRSVGMSVAMAFLSPEPTR